MCPPRPRSPFRDHCSWKQGGGQGRCVAEGALDFRQGSQPEALGPAPFVRWSPLNWPGMVRVTPSS